MRSVIQRVSKASVTIDEIKVSEINNGLLILLGIEEADDKTDIEWLTKKIANLRVFNDENGVMNKSLLEINGEAIVVSQFCAQDLIAIICRSDHRNDSSQADESTRFNHLHRQIMVA